MFSAVVSATNIMINANLLVSIRLHSFSVETDVSYLRVATQKSVDMILPKIIKQPKHLNYLKREMH
jgi:hypothetical protein